MGEKFSVAPATGTASFSVPLATTPSRSGLSPALALGYDSGAGNGPFGFGWRVAVPSVTRKTDRGLPQYQDGTWPGPESDVYILSAAEDLVPAYLQQGAAWVPDSFSATLGGGSYTVRRYRPRVEAGFARIERWRNDVTGETFWKTVTRENVTSLFGSGGGSRIADPTDPLRVFSWLLDTTYDDRGNVIVYEYKPEDSANVPPSLHESNRQVTANRYLKRIYYGNRTPFAPGGLLPSDWCFQVVFDYGEHDPGTPAPDEVAPWRCRPDPFSSYRAAFEIRTYRICRRVLMFHQFPAELGPAPYLVRSTDLTYSFEQAPADPQNPVYSFLASVQASGYIRQAAGAGYDAQSLPPLTFTYSPVQLDPTVRFADADSLQNLPAGVDGKRYRWADLDGEGSPGVLSESGGAWYYKRNTSNLPSPADGSIAATFEPVELLPALPSTADLAGGAQQLVDVTGDGQLDLVQYAGALAGYYERDEDAWAPFRPFAGVPSIDWNDPNLRMVDLDGDGLPDVLITGDTVFTWYQARAAAASGSSDAFGPAGSFGVAEAFGPPQYVPRVYDERLGPALVFGDATHSEGIYLADMTGDGLSDLVRVRNGEVCYWPNLGYGRFGGCITMDDAPWFDAPDQFDERRVRLADIDGSGTADLLYLGRDQITFWFNQSGNSWGAPQQIAQFPATDDLDSVSVVDLLGAGTGCLVWSSPLPGDAACPLRYIDLMGAGAPAGQARSQKPHLLIGLANNLGAETRLQYAASTRFYLQDRLAGQPWITRLPFPVQVVAAVETQDYVSGTRLSSVYAYHHGYYDGIEREFRGFGMVEQSDTESFSKYSGAGLFTSTPQVEGEEFYLPPTRTRTWYHTGAFLGWEAISQFYAAEYYAGDPAAVPLPDSTLPGGLGDQEVFEAARALKGRILRRETYADDGSPQAGDPYSAVEYTYTVRLLQPLLDNPHASFYAHESESLAYTYERRPQDPRLAHSLTLAVDDYGSVTRGAAVAYPRRAPAYPEQAVTLITYTENDVANRPDESGWYRLGVPVETRVYELTGVPRGGILYTESEMIAAAAAAAEIPYEAAPQPGILQKRMIRRTRALYLSDDLAGPLPAGQIDSRALPFERYRLAFTPGLLGVYGGHITPAALSALLSGEGGYRDLDGDGHWWIPSGQAFYSPNAADTPPVELAFALAHFFLPHRYVDPFGNTTVVHYDDPHVLLVLETDDALGNRIIAGAFDAQGKIQNGNDYRVVQHALMTDPNLNRSAVQYDALGLVVAAALMGKPGAGEGDTLADPTTKMEYDLSNWQTNTRPNYVHTLAREQHGAANTGWLETYAYSDGSGHEVMRKVQAEPGPAPVPDANGVLQCNANLQPADPRWAGTGRTIYDNKGNPIKQYEPFFSSTFDYEDEPALVRCGVTPILRYDPPGRVIRTDLPDGSFTTVEFDAWQQITSDANDTVTGSAWYAARGAPDPNGPQPAGADVRAAWLAAQHAGTPTTANLDTLGRAFLTLAHNRYVRNGTLVDESYPTRLALDIQGYVRSVGDAMSRAAMTYDYDMLGSRIHQSSIDAGERWMLKEAAGKPVRAWDSRAHQLRYAYDTLRRPAGLFVATGGGPEALAEQTVYGEGQASDQALNLRTRLFRQLDGAGTVTHTSYDFKGNLLSSTRQLLQDYRDPVDWSAAPAPDPRLFTTSATYDALNRPVTLTAPDASVVVPAYNEANLLERLDVNLRGATAATPFVTNLDYNARGQRELIQYNNAASTTYEYDPDTFRLTRLRTTRPSDNAVLQDLLYTFDPAGNITQIQDAAQQTVFFNNQVVDASAEYVYDAIYRLISATGREQIGQAGQPWTTWNDGPRMNQPLPGDGQAMRNYAEAYQYDAVGNILALVHTATNGNWTRTCAYDEPDSPPATNRLSSSTVGGGRDAYTYDPQGNMLTMPQLALMGWDFKNQLQVTQQQVVSSGPGERTYYVYNAAGQRVRKVTERANGTLKQERIYLGGYEVYREYDGAGAAVTLERETLHVTDNARRVALVETVTVDVTAAPGTLPVATTRYQHDNHLGSACLELDGSAAIISYEEYYPYGSTSYQAGRSVAEVSLKRYRYTGKERDEESGLYYHRARYYAPWLARWTAADPAGLADGPNLYVYCSNNPVTMTDPQGTQGQEAEQKKKPNPQKAPEQKKSDEAEASAGDDLGAMAQRAWAAVVTMYERAQAAVAEEAKQKQELAGKYPLREPSEKQEATAQANKEQVLKERRAIEFRPVPQPDPVTPGVDVQTGGSAVGLKKGASAKPSFDFVQVTLLPRNLELIPLYFNKAYDLDIALFKEPGAQVAGQRQPSDQDEKAGGAYRNHWTVSGTIDFFNLSAGPFEVAVTGTAGYDLTGQNTALVLSGGIKYTVAENGLPLPGTNKVRFYFGGGVERDIPSKQGSPETSGIIGGGLLIEFDPFEKREK